MRIPLVFTVFAIILPAQSNQHVTNRHAHRRDADDDLVTLFDTPLIFDAAAFPDPQNPGQTLAGLQYFVALREIASLESALSIVLSGLGIVGADVETAADRLKWAAAVPLSGKQVTVNVNGCSQQATGGPTSGFPDAGMSLANVSLGTCDGSSPATGTVQLTSSDDRTINFSVFNSPDSGFGVISDIDDTVKITHVLNQLEALETTLLQTPQPVSGMPDLYASLAKSLPNVAFFYVSGSPFQLFPFLQGFIGSTYSASPGPIFLQNLTLIDLPSLIDFTKIDGIQEYKDAMIDRIKGMYPNKKFLTVGDSTQRDPESYGDAFRKYGGNTIACIWIRVVDGANNTDARFAAAFNGVPPERIQLYNDAQIPALQQVDIAGGRCTL